MSVYELFERPSYVLFNSFYKYVWIQLLIINRVAHVVVLCSSWNRTRWTPDSCWRPCIISLMVF